MVETMSPAVLIVEDEALIALDLETTLSGDGFEPITVATVAAGHRWLDVITPEAAILDIMLPDGSCEAIAEKLVGRGVPFVVYSGTSATSHAGTFLALGTWIRKPTNSSDILIRLREACDALPVKENKIFPAPGIAGRIEESSTEVVNLEQPEGMSE
jgi:DNA-binding response OmpR family regulator